MELQKILDDLKGRAFTEVPFAISRADIDAAVQHFFTFLERPTAEKTRWQHDIKLDQRDRGTDLGYRLRSSSYGEGFDSKEFFHYNGQVPEIFAELLAQDKAASDFLAALDPIYRSARTAMGHIIKLLDGAFPGFAEKFFSGDQPPIGVLRLLKYDQGSTGNFLAKGHYDRSCCTLAIAESAPGLRIGFDDKTVTDITHNPGQALFFTGLMISELTKRRIRPAWHDVIQQPGVQYKKGAARWAMVFFASPPGAVYFSRKRTHQVDPVA